MPFDLVVTVCDTAAEECPLWLGSGQRLHIVASQYRAKAVGSDEERMAAFRQVRDQIVARGAGTLLRRWTARA